MVSTVKTKKVHNESKFVMLLKNSNISWWKFVFHYNFWHNETLAVLTSMLPNFVNFLKKQSGSYVYKGWLSRLENGLRLGSPGSVKKGIKNHLGKARLGIFLGNAKVH